MPAESAALLSFKAGIKEDPAGLLANWLPHTDYCNWDYVGCNSKGHVISVNFSGEEEEILSGLEFVLLMMMTMMMTMMNSFVHRNLLLY